VKAWSSFTVPCVTDAPRNGVLIKGITESKV
jgi:hypothetical protein